MKITVLCENTAKNESFIAEHGLSLFLECEGGKILFDMGQTDAFSKNAEQLGVCLDDVDLAILSHGHYDHGGGIGRFFALNAHAPLYLSGSAFGEHYHGKERYIGLDRSLLHSPRIRFVGEDISLGEGITLLSCAERQPTEPIRAAGLTVKEGGVFLPEEFLHEQYLLVEEAGKRILVSGCSHRGVCNILQWFSPDVFIGGLHLSGLDPTDPLDAQTLDAVADRMQRSGALFLTGHCTGEASYRYLRARLGDRIRAISTGDRVEV